jgi:hypothetical protein
MLMIGVNLAQNSIFNRTTKNPLLYLLQASILELSFSAMSTKNSRVVEIDLAQSVMVTDALPICKNIFNW